MAVTPVQPQPVLSPLTRYAIFLTLVLTPGREQDVRDALGDISGTVRAVGFRAQEGGLSCVTGLGAEFWDRAFTAPRPAGLHPFVPLDGPVHSAPSTPGDLFFHIRAQRMDLCFELALRLTQSLEGLARVVDEVHGFRYGETRDLLGFVDGTENPAGVIASRAALTGPEDRFPGSSIVIVQRYDHDLAAWNELSVEQQEAAFGRHKLSDIEFPDEDKAPDSHLALNVIEEPDGTERKILRDNMPFGSVGERTFGTYFIGYAADVDTTEQMLRNMFLGNGDVTHDRVLDFSTARTGALFFVPSQDALDDPDLLDAPLPDADGSGAARPVAGAPAQISDALTLQQPQPAAAADADADDADGDDAAQADPAASGTAADSSLGIGGLRGRPQH